LIRWKTAKTYTDAPHEYILRDWNPEVYAYFEEKLKTEAVKEPFTLRGRTSWYRYYYEGDYKYWAIPPILNRVRADHRTVMEITHRLDDHH